MTFTKITIPDPAEVKAMMKAEFPDALLIGASYDERGWCVFALRKDVRDDPNGRGSTPEVAIADLKEKLAKLDPLAKARRELEAAGYAVIAPDYD